MHGAAVAQVFGCAGAVLAVGLNAPQAWTSCVHGKVSGLSPAGRWLAVAQSVTWLVYGVVEHVRLQLVTNLVCTSLQLSVLAALLLLDPAARAGKVVVPQAGLATAWLGAVAWCALTGLVPVSALAAGVGALAVVPQVWRLRQARDEDTSGVSVATTGLALVASVCWAVHGTALGLPAVVLPSLVGAAASAWTLALLRPPVRRPGAPQVAPPVGLVLRRSLTA